MASVYTAIPLTEKGLKQSLLHRNTEDESFAICDDHQHNLTSKDASVFGCWILNFLTSPQFIKGFLVGFIIQTVSLGSTAVIAIYYGVSEEDSHDQFVFKKLGKNVFLFLSQSWWFLLPIICLSIDWGFTRSQGQATLAKYFCKSSPKTRDSESHQSKREVFLGCVRFHVGIVSGCFMVWSMVDLYFGASPGVFAALVASLLGCLGLCYSMIVIYDRFINDEEEQETQHSLLEVI